MIHAHLQGVKYEVRDPNDEVIKTAGCDNEVSNAAHHRQW